MPINLLIVGPSLSNPYCNPLDLAICTRAGITPGQTHLKIDRTKEGTLKQRV
jgi:hypothetical protein